MEIVLVSTFGMIGILIGEIMEYARIGLRAHADCPLGVRTTSIDRLLVTGR